MNSGDTPLNTAALLIEKQKTAQSPFVILSGGGQTFSTGWVTAVFGFLIHSVFTIFTSGMILLACCFPKLFIG